MDAYDRKARLLPGYILIAPLVGAISLLFADQMPLIGKLVPIVTAAGLPFLTIQVVREAGRRKELGLERRWGGKPSAAMFRHRDEHIDQVTKANYHAAMAKLVIGSKAPTREEEEANPDLVDHTYRAWAKHLSLAVRGNKNFQLANEENINYGFRRNLFGMRSVGIVLTLLTLCICVGRGCWLYQQSHGVSPEALISACLSVVMMTLWIFIFNESWVRSSSEAYARRLSEAIGELSKSRSADTG